MEKTVEQCDHDWYVYGTRISLLCSDDTKMIEKIKCDKCETCEEREGVEKVWDFIHKHFRYIRKE
jgi:hypothetical protein